jgi:hypothetical protein
LIAAEQSRSRLGKAARRGEGRGGGGKGASGGENIWNIFSARWAPRQRRRGGDRAEPGDDGRGRNESRRTGRRRVGWGGLAWPPLPSPPPNNSSSTQIFSSPFPSLCPRC